MDLGDPTKVVSPTLEGPVLAVFASTGRPLTVGEVAAETVRGSEIGIRRSISRLVEQGILKGTFIGRNKVYHLNEQHLAAPIVDLLAGLRLELWRRLRETMTAWTTPSLLAYVFGSAARGDGDSESDIDLLLVHPPFSDEEWLGMPKKLASFLKEEVVSPNDESGWQLQLDRLRELVLEWTGNDLQIVDFSVPQFMNHAQQRTRLLASLEREGIPIIKPVPELGRLLRMMK